MQHNIVDIIVYKVQHNIVDTCYKLTQRLCNF